MNVRDGSFSRDGLAFIDNQQAARLEGVIVEADDVLLNITGASVARVCRAPRDVLPARVNQHVAIVRPTDSFDSRFLEQCLLYPSMKRRLLRIAGAGATREAITKDAIERLTVIRPPRDEQDSFANLVRARERLELAQRGHLNAADALFSSLEHRAFRGML
jgi:type I restriction enzyme S subunit